MLEIYKSGYVSDLSIQDNPKKPMFGWLFYKHPDGQWVSLVDLKKYMGVFLPPPSCEKEPKP